MSLAAILAKDTVTWARSTTARDASGGQTKTWSTLYANDPARVEDMSAKEQAVHAEKQMDVDHRIFTQRSGISVGDRVTTSDSRQMLVQGVQKRRTLGGMPTFYVVLALELRPGA